VLDPKKQEKYHLPRGRKVSSNGWGEGVKGEAGLKGDKNPIHKRRTIGEK